MSQNLPKRSVGDFLFYFILTISYLTVQTIETSSYPTIPRGPCSSKSRFFCCILTVYFNCKYFLNIRASCYNASSGFRLLGEILAGAIMRIFGQSTNQNRVVTSLDSINGRAIHTLRLSFVMLLIHRKGVFVERNTAMHTHSFPNLEHTKMLQKALSRNFHEIIEESP